MKRNIFILSVVVIIITAPISYAITRTPLPATTSAITPTHLNKDKNPLGCAGCHKNHGKPSSPMLRDSSSRLCFICHGPFKSAQSSPVSHPEEQAAEEYSRFQKKSRHPVMDTAQYHRANEVLPETNPSAPRHVSCDDCHEVHSLRNDKKLGRIRGVTTSGEHKFTDRTSEICYKCHWNSVNRSSETRNVKAAFQVSNPSYHPVERAVKKNSISLVRSIVHGSTLECTDCHESHGSDYSPLLKKNYSITDTIESVFAYDLCYTCHRRESILNNESFKGTSSKQYGHKEHIVFQRASCHTCHSAHGSQSNASLVEFDPAVVSGPRQYVPFAGGNPTCILTCHGKEHNPKTQQAPTLPGAGPGPYLGPAVQPLKKK